MPDEDGTIIEADEVAMPTMDKQPDDIVKARRKVGYGPVTVISDLFRGWLNEGESMPMRREEAESREDFEIEED